MRKDRCNGTWWWLSFVEPRTPERPFLGVTVVRAEGMVAAVKRSHALRINPGGQVSGRALNLTTPPPAELCDRLATDRATIEIAVRQWLEQEKQRGN